MSTAFSPQLTAACLLPAWQSHGCVNVLPETLRPADRAQAYQAQWALWDACGEPGIGWKIAAERGFGIVDQNRHIEGAIVTDQERTVVGDDLGQKRDQENRREKPKRPQAAPVGGELSKASSCDRAWL